MVPGRATHLLTVLSNAQAASRDVVPDRARADIPATRSARHHAHTAELARDGRPVPRVAHPRPGHVAAVGQKDGSYCLLVAYGPGRADL